MKTAIELIAEERQRQIEKEGYSTTHDDEHAGGEIAMAAACMAAPKDIYELRMTNNKTVLFEDPYPWGEETYSRGEKGWHHLSTAEKKKGKKRLRQLQIAGALIVAEMERLQRADG